MKHFTKKWLCILLSFYASFSFAQVNVQDSLELIRFYHDVCVDCPLVWDFLEPVETWEGIAEISNSSRIRRIDLGNKGLNGILNDWNFPFLWRLSLDNNELTGSIPNFMYMNLDFLDLGKNNLTGNIPDFTHIPRLEILYLSENNLTGSIPDFSNLYNLEDLRIAENNLSDSIPNFSKFPSLRYLDLYQNYDLIGTMPDFNLPTLTGIRIGRTDISGEMPDFSGMPNLTSLDMNRNEFTGEIPDFSFLPNLQTLNLEANELMGNIPNFSNLTSLQNLYLKGNHDINGSIPNFDNLPQLKVLDLSRNKLTDTIPHFANPNLEHILLNNNQLTGSIPDFTTLQFIEEINLNDNLLSGCYPENFLIYCDESIYEIDFTENIDLPNEGDISLFCDSGLGNCISNPETDSLELVYFYENACPDCVLWDFSQPFNTWQGVTTDTSGRVSELRLVDMNLTGTLTDLNLSELKKINLDSNQLSGGLPRFSNLKKLVELSLTDNQFSGEIYNYDLPNLQILELYNNQLSREIPNFDKLPLLSRLILSGNQLYGFIPNFNLPNLTVLGLSYNQLQGNIPHFDSMPNLLAIGLNNNDLTGNIHAFLEQPNLLVLHLYNNNLNGNCFPSDLQRFCGMPEDFIQIHVNFQYLCSGVLECTGLVAASDSLELVDFYNATCNEGCALNWKFNEPVHSWSGVGVWDGRVEWLDLYNVGLSGALPDLDLPYLGELHLNYNNLSGQIPNFTHLDSLLKMNLAGNDFEGDIPNFNLPKLAILDLYRNQELEGELPNFEALTDMYRLRIGGTGISGGIPNYSHMDSLVELDLNSNRLTGTIPNFNFSKLCTLNLTSNRYLEGAIPNFDSLPELQVLSLGRNQLTDTIPNFDSLPNLVELGLFDNKLTGNIPSFTHLSQLSDINLARNYLTGTIPEFSTLPILVSLDLAGNELTGTVPNFSGSPFLVSLDIDDNKLSGSISGLSALPFLQSLDIEENYFTFDEIQEYLAVNNALEFDYSPQYHGTVQAYSPEGGDTLTLALSEPLPGNNNDNVNYEWKKNYDEDNETTVGTDTVYIIEDFQLINVGIYTSHMTDATRVPDLEVISEPIYVRKAGYDLLGEPVTYRQLIVEFEDKNAQQRYEQEYLWPGSGIRADACDCNRLLYLWQFPNENITYDVFIDINTKTENQGESAVVDGGFNNIVELDSIPTFRRWTWTGDYSGAYKDSVLVFLLDSGTDTQNWNATPYMIDEAPIDSCYEINAAPGYDYTDTLNSINTDFRDSLGHGTFGMRSIAEDSDFMDLQVVPLKIFNQQGQGTLFNFVCALYHAIDHGADIINISAGYSGTPSDILESAVAFAQQKDVFIVTAAGNDTTDIDIRPQYPAYYAKIDTLITEDTMLITGYDNVISVASMSPTNDLSGFSNYGKKAVTLAAYGEDMAGHLHTGELVSRSGSSIATYYVTRQLASVIAEDSERTYQEVWQDFEHNQLRACPPIEDLTSTGKCLDIRLNETYGDFSVYLEGAYNSSTQKMNTNLFTLNLLPGQENNPDNRQPYHVPPFNYQGNERASIYPDSIVDWVLVSLREDTLPESEVARTAAWLMENGQIELLKPLSGSLNVEYDSVYVVIEHRNHMAAMSPEKIPARQNLMSWDFRLQNSFARGGTGQKELSSGIWGMLAGDGEHNIENYDINGDDKIIWSNLNGQFLIYLLADYNMDGDVNGADKAVWQRNNGIFSAVRR